MSLQLIIPVRVVVSLNFLTLSKNSWTGFLHALAAPDVLVESFSKRFTSSSPIRVPLSGGGPSLSLAREPNLVKSMMMMRWTHFGAGVSLHFSSGCCDVKDSELIWGLDAVEPHPARSMTRDHEFK